MWTAHCADDIRLGVCGHLWPQEWLRSCTCLCRVARRFFARRDVRMGLLALLPADAFTLVSPLWQLLRRGIHVGTVDFLEPAFAVMGSRQTCKVSAAGAANGSSSRLLGRCFTLAAQKGASNLVDIALRCRADLEQRINGQSALDSAAQAGHLSIVRSLLLAQALPAQTAASRWTPLMRAALGGHLDVCTCLIGARALLDQYADRSTALDVADANGHVHVVAKLHACSARRYAELRDAERRPAAAARPVPALHGMATAPADAGAGRRGERGRLRPGPASLGGGLPRGVFSASAVLHLRDEEDEEGPLS